MSRREAALILLVLGSVLGLALTGCSDGASVAADPPDPMAPAAAGVEKTAASATVLDVSPGPEVVSRLLLDSRISGETEVWLVARTSGRLIEVHADRGDVVKKGQVLAEFDRAEELLFVQAAEAELAHAKSVTEAREALVQDDAFPAELLREVRLDFEIKQARLKLARHRLDRTTISAPFDGVILDRKARRGMHVLESDGTRLFLLSGDGPLEARAYLPEWALSYLQRNAEVQVIPRFDGGPRSGRLHWLSPVVDPVAGTVEVRVRLTGDSSIRMGSAVALEFPLTSDPGNPALPHASFVGGAPRPGTTAQVLRWLAPGQWEPADVRVGVVGANLVEVCDGLVAGDRIVAHAVGALGRRD